MLKGEGDVFLYVEELNISFVLELEGTNTNWGDIQSVKNIPATVKIGWILVL